MNTPTVLSDSSLRQKRGKKKLFLKSCGLRSQKDNFDQKNCQRSSSLSTLVGQAHTIGHTGSPAIAQPRMAQLETLEAKMAHIEVSLSVTPRRKRGGSVGGGSIGGISIGCSTLGPATPAASLPGLGCRDAKNIPREKEFTELSSKEHPSPITIVSRSTGERATPDLVAAVAPVDARCAPASSDLGVSTGVGAGSGDSPNLEERAGAIRNAIDHRRAIIKNLKLALERLDITDNIDIRIQQAELEYRLGREELELLTLHEQGRALNAILAERNQHESEDDSQKQTLFSCMRAMKSPSIYALEVEFDPESPRFGAGPRRSASGLWIEWAAEKMDMSKGDRLLEVNGKLVVSCRNKEELVRLLSISPSPAQLVILRSSTFTHLTSANPSQVDNITSKLGLLQEHADEITRTKEGLQADNLRLTHRISYLEEQVAELLSKDKNIDSRRGVTLQEIPVITARTKQNKANTSLTSELQSNKPMQSKSDVQVFQKGPDITAIVANLPGLEAGAKNTAEASANLPIVRPKSNISNYSSPHITVDSLPKNFRAHSVASTGNSEKESRQEYKKSQPMHKSQKVPYHVSKSSQSLDKQAQNLDKHRYHQPLSRQSIDKNPIDYNAETAAALEIIKRNQRHYLDMRGVKISEENSNSRYHKFHHRKSILNCSDNETEEKRINKLNKIRSDECIDEYGSDHNSNKNSIRKSISVHDQLDSAKVAYEGFDFNPERDFTYRIDGKVIENTHKSSRRHAKLHTRSVKSLDFDSETSDNLSNYHVKNADYSDSTPVKYYYNEDVYVRPMPPKKPLRLSLHRAQSAQSDHEKYEKDSAVNYNSHKYHKSSERLDHYSMRQTSQADLSPMVTRKPTKRSFKGNKFNFGDLNMSKTSPRIRSSANLDLISSDRQYDGKHATNPNERNGSSPMIADKSARAESHKSKSHISDVGYNLLRWSLGSSKLLVNENNGKINGHLSDGGKWC